MPYIFTGGHFSVWKRMTTIILSRPTSAVAAWRGLTPNAERTDLKKFSQSCNNVGGVAELQVIVEDIISRVEVWLFKSVQDPSPNKRVNIHNVSLRRDRCFDLPALKYEPARKSFIHTTFV